jgi:hypothetical protein
MRSCFLFFLFTCLRLYCLIMTHKVINALLLYHLATVTCIRTRIQCSLAALGGCFKEKNHHYG